MEPPALVALTRYLPHVPCRPWRSRVGLVGLGYILPGGLVIGQLLPLVCGRGVPKASPLKVTFRASFTGSLHEAVS